MKKKRTKKHSPRLPPHTHSQNLKNHLLSSQGLGVGALRRTYGGRNKPRGCAPERHALAAGGRVRHILQQLESIGIVEKSAEGLA